MTQDRAGFWLAVVGLLGIGIMLGQMTVMMIAAMAAVTLAYQNDRILFP
jgi:hypothetical protein